MPRILFTGLAALLICTAPVCAQTTPPAAQNRPGSAEDLKAMTDTRIEITKAALQLTPAQEKLWPALEEAMRARAAARQQRLTQLAAHLNSDRETNLLEVLGERATALSQRGATLKKLVDAWQPLFQTLDDHQKTRARILVMYTLREMKDALSSRMEELEESEEW